MKLRNKKTGEITDNIYVYEGLLCVDVWKGKSGYYDTLTELNEDWEDYKPTQSLIKDEKIRKAVIFKAEALAGAIEQSVKEFIDDIAELCGEEEE